MTTKEALALAQYVEPLDLVKRVDYIEAQRDRCDADDLAAWTEALDITRNGTRPRSTAKTAKGRDLDKHDARWRFSKDSTIGGFKQAIRDRIAETPRERYDRKTRMPLSDES